MAEDDSLDWLMKWYHSHCDGDWEHGYGITIENIDNPGWHLRVELTGTELEATTFEDINYNLDDETSWWSCFRRGTEFHAYCGPFELSAVIGVFRKWATAIHTR